MAIAESAISNGGKTFGEYDGTGEHAVELERNFANFFQRRGIVDGGQAIALRESAYTYRINALVQGGSLLLSGFYQADEEALIARANELGLTLKNKKSRDADSYEMIDIILQSRVYDIGYIYNLSITLPDMFNNLVSSGSTDFASKYKARSKKATKALESIIKKYSKI